MRNLRKLCVAAVAFCAVPAASFADINDWDINDWDINDWDDDYSFAAPAGSAKKSTSTKKTASSSGRSDGDFGLAPAEPAAAPAETENQGNSFSIAVFYAVAADEYVAGSDDSKIDTVGLILRVNHEFRSPGAAVGLDLGLLTAYAYGAKSDIEGSGIDADQFDVMADVYFGPRIGNAADGASFGIGVFGGIDFRRLSLEYSSDETDDTALGFMGGVYADLQIRLSDECAFSLSYHYAFTNVEMFDEYDLGDYLEKEIGYHMFSVGLTFFW